MAWQGARGVANSLVNPMWLQLSHGPGFPIPLAVRGSVCRSCSFFAGALAYLAECHAGRFRRSTTQRRAKDS
jgi:hypothetical protein